jgi:uncharacterized protein (DUF2235 family)
MSKRIIFCCDGTWDDSGKNTNVYKFYKATEVSADQVPFYDDGVGSDGNPIERLTGAAFGFGLYQKIKDAYSKISQVYEQGDSVYLFGFSRGAYTARSLAGMIAVCGLPTKAFSNSVVDAAFNAYRASKDDRPALLKDWNATCALFDAKITMVGVWETVGALGIPSVFGGVDPILYGFLDTNLHPDVQNAYHAVSIDERRSEFPATLWTSQSPGQTVEQVYFAGVHSDVGGSYPDDPDGTALADVTLTWMMKKAADLKVTFVPSVAANYPFPANPKWALDTKHESWNILWAFPRRRSIAANAMLANSVIVRCENDTSYHPGNLQYTNGQIAASYNVVPVVGTVPATVTTTVTETVTVMTASTT